MSLLVHFQGGPRSLESGAPDPGDDTIGPPDNPAQYRFNRFVGNLRIVVFTHEALRPHRVNFIQGRTS